MEGAGCTGRAVDSHDIGSKLCQQHGIVQPLHLGGRSYATHGACPPNGQQAAFVWISAFWAASLASLCQMCIVNSFFLADFQQMLGVALGYHTEGIRTCYSNQSPCSVKAPSRAPGLQAYYGKLFPMKGSADLIATSPVLRYTPTASPSAVTASDSENPETEDMNSIKGGRDQPEEKAETDRPEDETNSNSGTDDAQSTTLTSPRSPSLDATTLPLPGDGANDFGDLGWMDSESESEAESSAKPAVAGSTTERPSLRRLRVFIIENEQDQNSERCVKPRREEGADKHAGDGQGQANCNSPRYDMEEDSQFQ